MVPLTLHFIPIDFSGGLIVKKLGVGLRNAVCGCSLGGRRWRRLVVMTTFEGQEVPSNSLECEGTSKLLVFVPYWFELNIQFLFLFIKCNSYNYTCVL